MGKTFVHFLKLALAFNIAYFHTASSADLGTLTCKNGTWTPDAKLIGFGLGCPLPLDGKSSSKGKTTVCGFKKAKLYDGKTVKRDQIAPVICGVLTQDKLNKECKQKIQGCIKNGKGYFKDPKTDTEYKSWSPPYECLEKWVQKACKK